MISNGKTQKLVRVIPVVALLPERSTFRPIPNCKEVEAVFDAPLDMFLKGDQHRIEERKWLGFIYRLHYFDFELNNKKYLIWGDRKSVV